MCCGKKRDRERRQRVRHVHYKKKKKKILPPKPKPPRVSVRLRENSKAGKFFPLFHLTSWEDAASDGSLHVACDEAGKSPDFSGPDRALSTVM